LAQTGRTLSLALALSAALPFTAATADAPGIDIAGIDRAVAPGDDFFAYANGAWYKATAIPEDRATCGASAIVYDRTSQRTVELIQDAAKAEAALGGVERKVGDYYTSFMDEAGIEAKGLTPVRSKLDAIAAIADRRGLSRYLGTTLRADVDALNATNFYTDNLLGLWVAQDLDEPSRYVPFLMQGGLDMPERTYYDDPSPQMAETRARFQSHVVKILELGQIADAAARGARVVDLERRIAEVHASREDSSDVKKSNNHWTREALDTSAPGLDWAEYLSAAGLAAQPAFVVWHPAAVTGIAALVASQPLDAWKD
jgi:putative endopeptidase